MESKKLLMLPIAMLSMAMFVQAPVFAADSKLPEKPEEQSKAAQSVQSEVDAEVAKKAEEKRKAILADAQVALNETRSALKLLEEKKPKEALAALERVTGKLELIVAREPKLALAPVSSKVITHDLLANLDTVEAIIKEAKDYLDDGEIQKARPLVANLASEMVFETTSIPLATYPDAIKAVAPLIDDGKIDEAKTALQVALNTLVVTVDDVIPLPTLRAEQMLKNAEKLAEQKDRTDEDNETLANLLKGAREQLKLAQLLGYGDKKAYKPMYEQIEQIEKKSEGGKSGKGWFDKIKQQLSDLI